MQTQGFLPSDKRGEPEVSVLFNSHGKSLYARAHYKGHNAAFQIRCYLDARRKLHVMLAKKGDPFKNVMPEGLRAEIEAGLG